MTARVSLIGLLGAVAILATFAFPATDRASAEGVTFTYSVECHADSYWYVTDGSARVSTSNIPCDEAKPGWTFDWNNLGDILFLYDGDRTTVPVTRADGTVTGTAVREVNEQGNKRPPVNQPVASTNGIVYTADDNNRAVRGDDGNCYREQRVNGQWKRSGVYGPWAYHCQRASWNAYYRSQGEPLRHPVSGTFPSGNPPAAGN